MVANVLVVQLLYILYEYKHNFSACLFPPLASPRLAKMKDVYSTARHDNWLFVHWWGGRGELNRVNKVLSFGCSVRCVFHLGNKSTHIISLLGSILWL